VVKLKEEETMDRNWPIRLMAVLLVVPAFACADNDETEVEINSEAPPPAAMAPVTVQLEPLSGWTGTGEVVATHGADDVNVRVSVSGLTEGEDYEAKLKYGMCTDAQMHWDDRDMTADATNTPGTTPAAGQTDAAGMDHEAGDEFAEIELNLTGTTATGETDIDTGELGANEPAYVTIEIDDDMGDDDRLLACADLSGHGSMNMDAGTGATPDATTPGTGAPSTEPGSDTKAPGTY
jgi:hypothetical protein